jgi:hypothetical protein
VAQGFWLFYAYNPGRTIFNIFFSLKEVQAKEKEYNKDI